MIQSTLFHPKSIAIIGGSQNTSKPGGKIIENLLKSAFDGEVFVVNPKADIVQGLSSYHSIKEAPDADLVILAIPAHFCPQSIREYCEKGCKAFIVISAGFGELNATGKSYDTEIFKILDANKASLLGPNCIGLIHQNHHSVFTTPVPDFSPNGVEFISSSGSTAVFIMEAGMEIGLPFSNVYTVGNALQISVEDIIEHLDLSFEPKKSSKVLMIYIENIENPTKFIRHCRSLRQKGANIIVLKAGMTKAGGRAASSHTGAMASPAVAVEAMFRKAGVIQCKSRQEMLYLAAVLSTGIPEGENIAVITHAGGAGVLLTDSLENGALKVPEIKGVEADKLLKELFPGSSVKNPIDFLATGTAEQLELIIDHCDKIFNDIDGIAVIFGSPGLFDVKSVYELIRRKVKESKKPLYPILPSPINTREALRAFVDAGFLYFPDESLFGNALSKAYAQSSFNNGPQEDSNIDKYEIRRIIDRNRTGYLEPLECSKLLKAAKIPMVKELIVDSESELEDSLKKCTFPLVMKVIGPLHKSDSGGVITNIENKADAFKAIKKLMKKEGVDSILIQPMIRGHELYIGAKYEQTFGHLVLFGMGGIYLEINKDIQTLLAPLSRNEIKEAVQRLNSYPILEGFRGQKGISVEKFIDVIEKVAHLLKTAPEIFEMDLNPLIGNDEQLLAVDCRIHIKK